MFRSAIFRVVSKLKHVLTSVSSGEMPINETNVESNSNQHVELLALSPVVVSNLPPIYLLQVLKISEINNQILFALLNGELRKKNNVLLPKSKSYEVSESQQILQTDHIILKTKSLSRHNDNNYYVIKNALGRGAVGVVFDVPVKYKLGDRQVIHREKNIVIKKQRNQYEFVDSEQRDNIKNSFAYREYRFGKRMDVAKPSTLTSY